MKIDNGATVAQAHSIARSEHWPEVEKAHKAMEPNCAVCGISEAIQIHHVIPFHYCIHLGRPDLELDHRNLTSLCESESGKPEQNHHLLIGHLNDFKSSNVKVREDSQKYHGKTLQEIKESIDWKEEASKKMVLLDVMTPEQKKDLRETMDLLYPPDPVLIQKYGLTMTPYAG